MEVSSIFTFIETKSLITDYTWYMAHTLPSFPHLIRQLLSNNSYSIKLSNDGSILSSKSIMQWTRESYCVMRQESNISEILWYVFLSCMSRVIQYASYRYRQCKSSNFILSAQTFLFAMWHFNGNISNTLSITKSNFYIALHHSHHGDMYLNNLFNWI